MNAAGASVAHPTVFDKELTAMVHARIGSLHAAGALDAGNGDVLDRMIDELVAQRQAAVDSEAVHRRESVSRRIAQASASLEAASVIADDDLRRVQAVAVEIEAVCCRLSGDEATGAAVGDHSIDVAGLTASLAAQRAEARRDQKAALASVRVRSGSALKVKRSTTRRRALAAEQQYDARSRAHARASADLEAARAAFRGDAQPVAGLAPEPSPAPEVRDAQP